MEFNHSKDLTTASEYFSKNGAAKIKLPIDIIYATSSHAIWPIDQQLRWGEFEMCSLPAIYSSPISLVAPLQLIDGAPIVQKLVKKGIIPAPVMEDQKIKVKINGRTLERNLKFPKDGQPLIEKLCANYMREEACAHISL